MFTTEHVVVNTRGRRRKTAAIPTAFIGAATTQHREMAWNCRLTSLLVTKLYQKLKNAVRSSSFMATN